VLFHHLRGDEELGGDRGVGPALGDQREDLPLARGELRERIVTPSGGQQTRDDLGVEHGAAVGDRVMASMKSLTPATRSLSR
jgi:hypothetical protein